MIFRSFAVGLNYPSVSGSNSNSNQGVERSVPLTQDLGLLC